MPIYKGSRYEYSTIDFVETTFNSSKSPIVFYEFTTLGATTYYSHVYVEGERLDQIAHKYLKNSRAWWIIPEFNPEIVDFTNIAPGTTLRIPSV